MADGTDRRRGVSGSAAFKLPCRVATTAAITLSGLQTIDGVSLAADDRVLVKNQSSGVENGIYTADSGDWVRAIDCDGPRDVVQGTLILIVSGSVNGNTIYQLTTSSPSIGSTSLSFSVVGTAALFYASAFAQTLLDDTTAADARTTLGAVGLTGDETVGGIKAFTGANTHAGIETFAVSPVVPTKSAGDSTTAPATTAFVGTAIAAISRSDAVRQTVSSGPVDTAGLPSFLPGTSTGLTVTTQNVSSTYPLVATAANGWSSSTGNPQDTHGYSTANITWSGLTASRAAATPNFLYGTISGGVITPASTILAPVYQWGGTPAVTNGQITFNIAEMKAYLGNGTSAPQTNLVVFGEAATDGSNVISTVAYAYNGRYASAFTATLTNAGTTANCNIGAEPSLYLTKYVVKCTTTDLNYAVGDVLVNGVFTAATNSSQVVPYVSSRNIIGLPVVSNQAAPNKTSGALTVAFTSASWSYKFVVERGW